MQGTGGIKNPDEQQSTTVRASYTGHDGVLGHLEGEEAAAAAGRERLLNCQRGGRRSSFSASHHQYSHALRDHSNDSLLICLAQNSLPFCGAFTP